MKHLKFVHLSLLMGLISFSSCYDGVLEKELAPGMVVGSALDSLGSVDLAGQMLITAQERVIDTREHKYQYQFTFHIDTYAGYMSIPHSFSGRQYSSFVINDDFSAGPRANFAWVAELVVPIMASAKRLNIPEIGAMASILFSYAAHQCSSSQGPFPYFDYKVLKEEPPLTYVPLDVIYDSVLYDLDQSIKVLKHFQSNPTQEMGVLISKYDLMGGGKVDNWIKFANSLRLRMAMNMVKVEPGKAKLIAEDAVRQGVLDVGDNDIAIDLFNKYGSNHPLYKISQQWVDIRLAASLENILKRTDNPLLEIWFDKNHKELVNNRKMRVLDENQEYIGIRAGAMFSPQDKGDGYMLFSRTASALGRTPLALFKVAEVLFLRSEGALRGWNMGGTAKSFYEAGIRESFTKNGLEQKDYEKYVGMTSPKDVKYIDYYDKENNITEPEAYITIGNAWDEHDTNPAVGPENEVKLEKIITQKWIALYPMSIVAWTDQRRTGYPKLLPPVPLSVADGDGSIDPAIGIRRMPYTQGVDQSTKDDIQTSGIPALGGADEQGTRLWWDVDVPNF